MIEWTPVFIITCLTAYLAGSLSAAIIVCKIMKLPDPRKEGSNNPGATNVLRIGGKKAAAITLLGDAIKGVAPVLLGKILALDPAQLAVVGLLAFLGHLYPVFFQFKGGKGVATAFGVFIALSPAVAATALLTWLIIAFVFKISSLAALITAVLCPLYIWFWEATPAYTGMSILISALLLWRHRSNMANLVKGTEDKINE